MNLSSSGSSFRRLVRPIGIWTQDETLLFVAWESYRDGVAYLGAFDLNQWYSAQTPDTVAILHPEELCPFWAAFPFGSPGISSELYDVKLIGSSFQRWYSPHMEDDVHLYPSSITFRKQYLNQK